MPRWWLPLVLVPALAAGVLLSETTLQGQRRAKPAPRPAPPPAAVRLAAPPAPLPTVARSARNASYWIEASLDTAKRTVAGKETITWRNVSSASTSELRFHLYYNAWKNSRSTWLREALDFSRRNLPLSRLNREDWGWTQVSSLRLVGVGGAPPIDLTPQLRYDAPDDQNADDQTVLVAPLPRAIAPGETVNIAVDWNAQVPRTFARTGALDDYFFMAQWFPKIGVLEDDGLELPPVPFGHGVLRGLRHLRRLAHGAARLGRRRDRRRARDPRQRGRRRRITSTRRTSTISRGRRAPTTW